MARSEANRQQDLVNFLASVSGSTPQLLARESWGRRVRVARCTDYPHPKLTTVITLGASEQSFSLYRGRPLGFELTMTLAKEDPDMVDSLATAVVENLRLQAGGERRPFIEYNGIYAPGYPPHLLFTEQITATPELSGQKRVGDRYVSFLAAIPLDDQELREYDRNVPGLIEKIGSSGRIAEYPRKGRARPKK
jgi:hypothetical protein